MTQLENERTTAPGELEIYLPEDAENLAQNEEWFEIEEGGDRTRLRFHDYDAIYSRPGLYERLFYEMLECKSPQIVASLVNEAAESGDRELEDLRVLDVGAGNGMVGEEFRKLGAEHVVGVDIIPEAAAAAKRDRPDVYDDYLVTDLTAMSTEDRDRLTEAKLNCLVCVAALGFDDIPPEAFTEAYNSIEEGGYVGFCLRDEMVSGEDSSGFSRLIDEALVERAIELQAEERYRHRLGASGKPLYYVAMVGTKRADLPSNQ